MANAPKYNYFGVVLDAPKEKEGADMEATLKDYESRLFEMAFVFIATIIHDQDTRDNGEAKRTHLHAFLIESDTFTQGQELTRLEKALNVDRTQISIEGSNSEILLVQYLTHQNHPEKHQYKRDLIKTTNRERLDLLLDAQYEKPVSEEDFIQEEILRARTLTELMNSIGLKEANKYRGVFNQIKTEQRTSYADLAKRLDDALDDLKEAYRVVRVIVDTQKRGLLCERDIQDAEEWLAFYRKYYNLQED